MDYRHQRLPGTVMSRVACLVIVLGACTEPAATDVPIDDSVDLTRCDIVSSEPVGEPWSAVEGMATSADTLALTLLGQWLGNFEDIHGGYQPASLHMVPSAGEVYRVEYEDSNGSCGVFVEIPMDLFLDVPCLVYGDIPTTITVGERASGMITFNKLDAPRNLLDRPDFDAALLVGGSFGQGVLDVDLMWEGRDGQTAPAGSLSGALQ
ncbi:MAG: hypothetical protein ACJAZO_004398 [Myxococcota bacterium]